MFELCTTAHCIIRIFPSYRWPPAKYCPFRVKFLIYHENITLVIVKVFLQTDYNQNSTLDKLELYRMSNLKIYYRQVALRLWITQSILTVKFHIQTSVRPRPQMAMCPHIPDTNKYAYSRFQNSLIQLITLERVMNQMKNFKLLSTRWRCVCL